MAHDSGGSQCATVGLAIGVCSGGSSAAVVAARQGAVHEGRIAHTRGERAKRVKRVTGRRKGEGEATATATATAADGVRCTVYEREGGAALSEDDCPSERRRGAAAFNNDGGRTHAQAGRGGVELRGQRRGRAVWAW